MFLFTDTITITHLILIFISSSYRGHSHHILELNIHRPLAKDTIPHDNLGFNTHHSLVTDTIPYRTLDFDKNHPLVTDTLPITDLILTLTIL